MVFTGTSITLLKLINISANPFLMETKFVAGSNISNHLSFFQRNIEESNRLNWENGKHIIIVCLILISKRYNPFSEIDSRLRSFIEG